MNILLSTLLAATAMAGSALAADFHVAPNGSDANPGTAKKPFATIAKARDAARESRSQNPESRIQNAILLAPGRYFNDTPIILDDRDSGLTVKGEKSGAAAEIYGGVPVTGWEKWQGSIWRAPVPKDKRFFNLIVDGKPATMAQTPNAGSGYGGGVHFSNGRITVPQAWRNYDFSDAQVACFIGTCWFNEMRAVVADKADANGSLPILPCSGNFGGLNGGMSVVRGVLELLDEPGEWCLKHKEGYVYYWPESGAPADHLIVRPVSEKLLEVHGRTPETPAKNIAIRNVSLIGSDFCAAWELFKNENIDCNILTPPARQGLVFGENVDGLTVSGCRILAAGHSGVFLNHYAQGCVVENCLIAQAGVSAVYLHGWQIGTGPFKTLEESYVNKNNRIENCLIYDCGKFIPTIAAIGTYQSGDLLVARNEIAEQARCAFMVNGVRWGVMPKTQYGKKLVFKDYDDANHNRRVRVIGNDIYNVCRNTDDFGAIEAWGSGRDNLWENNAVHDLEHCQKWDTWGHAIFPDDSDPYMTVRGNIVHHFYGGRATRAIMVKNIEQVVENNLVVDCGINCPVTFGPYMEPAWEMTIRHNIFASTGEAGVPYGDMNDYCLTGKSYLDAIVPPGAKGIREVDYNWIVPKDPNHPNPLAEKYKVDLHSTFAPEPIKRLKPDWDIQAGDYEITPKPVWWQPIDCSQIGLRKDFPFDRLEVMRRTLGVKIQAESYQRRKDLRSRGGSFIYGMSAGSWTKYSDMDFGDGKAAKAVFQVDVPPAGETVKPFIRRYGRETVEEIPFKGDKSVETITCWEVSKPYAKKGKTGPELFDEVFAPEIDPKAGEWQPILAGQTSKLGVIGAPGDIDFDVIHGENLENSCAYARASIYAPSGRTNATMSITCASGAKVWLNGALILATHTPGTIEETPKGVIKAGWNTILVKVTQDASPWKGATTGHGNFWFKFGTVASSCGRIIALPGLPTEERAETAKITTAVEIRLDSPIGKVIGRLEPGKTECPVEKTTGIHNVYLVFPGAPVRSVDWFRFE